MDSLGLELCQDGAFTDIAWLRLSRRCVTLDKQSVPSDDYTSNCWLNARKFCSNNKIRISGVCNGKSNLSGELLYPVASEAELRNQISRDIRHMKSLDCTGKYDAARNMAKKVRRACMNKRGTFYQIA